MRKEREAKVKAKTEAEEEAEAEAKKKEKADIARLADESREKAKFEARARKNVTAVNRASVEAAAKIMASAEI